MRRVDITRSGTDVARITHEVSGKAVSYLTQHGAERVDIHFTDNSVLAIEVLDGRLAAAVSRSPSEPTGSGLTDGPEPTRRQREYLEFIARYLLRFGISPAEADIARHFLISDPSVNQMIQTLERKGFITRQRGIPRSIRIVDRTAPAVGPRRVGASGTQRPNKPLHRTRARVARSIR
jgi:repressor LexA